MLCLAYGRTSEGQMARDLVTEVEKRRFTRVIGAPSKPCLLFSLCRSAKNVKRHGTPPAGTSSFPGQTHRWDSQILSQFFQVCGGATWRYWIWSVCKICWHHYLSYAICIISHMFHAGGDLELVVVGQICRYQVHNLTITVLHCLEHRTFCYTMEKGSNSHVGWGCHMLERQCWFATKSGASEVVHRSHDVAIVLWLCSEDNFSIAYLKNGWTIACCAATWMNGCQDAIEQITWMYRSHYNMKFNRYYIATWMLQGWVVHGSGWPWCTGPFGFQPHCSDLAVVDSMSKHVDVLWANAASQVFAGSQFAVVRGVISKAVVAKTAWEAHTRIARKPNSPAPLPEP